MNQCRRHRRELRLRARHFRPPSRPPYRTTSARTTRRRFPQRLLQLRILKPGTKTRLLEVPRPCAAITALPRLNLKCLEVKAPLSSLHKHQLVSHSCGAAKLKAQLGLSSCLLSSPWHLNSLEGHGQPGSAREKSSALLCREKKTGLSIGIEPVCTGDYSGGLTRCLGRTSVASSQTIDSRSLVVIQTLASGERGVEGNSIKIQHCTIRIGHQIRSCWRSWN